jgi:hypothetical protein
MLRFPSSIARNPVRPSDINMAPFRNKNNSSVRAISCCLLNLVFVKPEDKASPYNLRGQLQRISKRCQCINIVLRKLKIPPGLYVCYVS